MKKLAAAAAFIIALIGTAGAAQARPAFCEPHDAGDVYITACAEGGGGAGPIISYLDAAGRLHQERGGEPINGVPKLP